MTGVYLLKQYWSGKMYGVFANRKLAEKFAKKHKIADTFVKYTKIRY
jgi:hypothetical protein